MLCALGRDSSDDAGGKTRRSEIWVGTEHLAQDTSTRAGTRWLSCRAEVAYKLKVELRMQGKLVPNIKSELPLHISEPPLRGEPHCDTVASGVAGN